MLKQEQKGELESIIEKAEEFHGHLGPFLVIGVRMGFVGLRKLELKRGTKELKAAAVLKCSVPFSCILDGIQVATGCTFGNQRLTLKNSLGIAVEFTLPNNKRVAVAVNRIILNKLEKRLLSKNASDREIQRLAQLVASMPEQDLFMVKESSAFHEP